MQWFVTTTNGTSTEESSPVAVKQEIAEDEDVPNELIIAEDDPEAPEQQDFTGNTSIGQPHSPSKPIIDATMDSEGFITCNHCEYKCRNPQTIRYHMYKHQPGVKKPFQCPYCPFSAYMRSHLANHVLIHTGERPQACPLCSYRARERTALKRHLKARHQVESLLVSSQGFSKRK